MKVYLDNAATTPVLKEVVETVKDGMINFYGNPESLNEEGAKANEALENARKTIANAINAASNELIFTSGATESNNLAILGLAYQNKDKNHIITTKIEHPSVLNCFEKLKKQGYEVTFLNVDKEGYVDLEELNDSITEKTALISVIHGNHEIGTIQNLNLIGKICKEKDVLLHVDASQSFLKVNIDVKKDNIALLTLNSHKIHGPKGVGALYIKQGIKLFKMEFGGPQEFDIRPGTQNVPAILGFAKAVELGLKTMEKDVANVKKLRDKIIRDLVRTENVFLNGPIANRLYNNVNICIKNLENERMLMHLNEKGIFIGTGSACTAKSMKPSHVLKAIGLKDEEARCSIRITLSKLNTEKEVDYALTEIKKAIGELRG